MKTPLVCLTWPRENRTPVVYLKGKHHGRNSFLFQEHPPIPDEGEREHSNRYSLKLEKWKHGVWVLEISCGFFLDGLPQLCFFSSAFSSLGRFPSKLHDFSPYLFSRITQQRVCVCGLGFFCFVGFFSFLPPLA